MTVAEAMDNRETPTFEDRELLRELRDHVFDGSDDELATALGRPVEEIRNLASGTGPLDEDVVMKARGLAQERGLGE